MSSHPLPRSASALFSHVMADNALLYRAILDVFAASKRQFRLPAHQYVVVVDKHNYCIAAALERVASTRSSNLALV